MGPDRPFSLKHSSKTIDDSVTAPTESDFEDLNSVGSDDELQKLHMADTDYWLGIRVFQMLLAMQVIEDPSESNLDFLLGERMSSCSYERLYDSTCELYARHPVNQSTEKPQSFRSFVTLLGSILRERGLEACFELDTLIRTGRAALVKNVTMSGAQRTDSTPGLEMVTEATTSMPQIFKYSMLLKEIGDREGDMPIWNENAQCDRPSLFRCTLLFRGNLYESFGMSKKAAKHCVSRKVCQILDLQP